MAMQRIALLLDKSGSMASLQRFAVEAMNEQIQTIKARAKELPVEVTLVYFNHDVEFVLTNRPASELPTIGSGDYVPSGGTAYRDAIGVTIDTLTAECSADDGAEYLVIIISDGEDLNSSIYGSTQIAEKIQMMKDKGWKFTHLGTNASVEQVKAMGVDEVATFGGAEAGVKGMVGPNGALGAKAMKFAGKRVASGLDRHLMRASVRAKACMTPDCVSADELRLASADVEFFDKGVDLELAAEVANEDDT